MIQNSLPAIVFDSTVKKYSNKLKNAKKESHINYCMKYNSYKIIVIICQADENDLQSHGFSISTSFKVRLMAHKVI